MRAKGERRIDYAAFVDALALIAAKTGKSLEEVVSKVLACQGPVVTGSRAEPTRFHDDKVTSLCVIRVCMRGADCRTVKFKPIILERMQPDFAM